MAGLEVSYLIALRHPLSVQQSLSRRDRLAAEKCHYLWLKYMLASVSNTEGCERCVVNYDRMMDEPEQQLRRIARDLDLTVQRDAFQAFTETFLTETLRHNRVDETPESHSDTIPADVRSTWIVLDRVARDELTLDDPGVADSLHAAKSGMDNLEPAFAYVNALEHELIRAIQQRELKEAEWNAKEIEWSLKEAEWQRIVDSYRDSTCWRITRPLRWLAGRSDTIKSFLRYIFN
jgi:hypothetical protein